MSVKAMSPITRSELDPFDPQRMLRRGIWHLLMALGAMPMPRSDKGGHAYRRSSGRTGKPAGLIRQQVRARRAHDSRRH